MVEDRPRSPFPWRGLLLGTLLIPPMTLFGVYAYIVAQATLWTQTSLQRGPIFTLFFIVLANLALRRFRARLCLTEQDLLLLYVMQCVATALGGIGWCQFMVPTLGAAAYFATPENKFDAFWDFIPDAWWVHDPLVVQNLFRGHSTLYDAANWAGVVKPFIYWSLFMCLLALAAFCLAQLLREQWISRERLTFPLTYLPIEMSKSGGTPSFWSNRLLWLGFGLAAFIDCVNALHFMIPSVPEITVKPVGALRLHEQWTQRPWNAMNPFVLSFYPFMIGIGFLLTLDVAFSCWAWYLILKVVSVVGVQLALADGPLQVGRFPYIPEQSVGAFLALAVLVLYRSRDDILGALRRDVTVNRHALFGFLACGAAILLLCGFTGLPTWLAGLWLLIYLAYSIGCARIVSETGSGWTFSPRLTPHDVILRAPGAGMLNPRQATLFSWLMPFDLDFRDAVLPQQIAGMRLMADDGGRGRPLLIGLLVATVVGVVAGMWAHLHVYFQYGIDSALTRTWPRNVGRQPFELLANTLKGNAPPPYAFGGVVFGAALFGALVAARTHILTWPLHPIGYALACTPSLDYLWLPFLIAWFIKLMVLRYGGMKAYRKFQPFFLGLILGDYVVPLLWACYGTLTGQQQYLSFPH